MALQLTSEPFCYRIPKPPKHAGRSTTFRIIATAFLAILSIAVYTYWPSDPSLKIVGMRLDHVRVHTLPHIAIDISLALSVKVLNIDFYGMDYKSVDVSIAYRGKELGDVGSVGGHIPPRASLYVDALVIFDGVDVLHDVVSLLEDLAKGSVPFETETEVKGHLNLFLFTVPIKAKVSCLVHVNTNKQTIVKQDCYKDK